jgi:basic membrane protein A and related proteins
MKRLHWWMAVLMALGLVAAACGDADDAGGGDGGDATTAEPAGTETTAAGDSLAMALLINVPPNDLGWAQAAYEAAKKLEAEGVVTLTLLENVPEDATSTARAVEGLVDDGVELVLAHSFNYGEPLKEIIGEFPDTAFAYAGGFGDVVENLADYDQPFFEPAFLAGILAGGVTETGIVGGTAGFNIPVCHAQLEAFRAGAELSYGSEVRLIEQYIGSWVDAALTKEAVLAGVEQGADVWITCGVPDGTIEAARESGVAVVGYVMDQSSLAPENVLASVVWNFDQIIRQMVDDVKAGSFIPARYYAVGFADGGTSVAVNPGFAGEISQSALDLYAEYEAKMRSGEFTVEYVPE